jgi:hypothetical protein
MQDGGAGAFASIMTMNSRHISDVTSYARNKSLIALLTAHPSFKVSRGANGRYVEDRTMMGRMFRFGADVDDVTITQLMPQAPNATNGMWTHQAKNDADRVSRDIQQRMAGLQTQLHTFTLKLLKGGPGSKSEVIEWFTVALESNAGRTKSQIDRRVCAGTSFMLNVFGVLLKLCDPFMNVKGASKVELDFMESLAHRSRLFGPLRDETRLAGPCSDEELSHFTSVAAAAKADFSFVTLSFFLAVRAFTLGPAHLIQKYDRQDQQLGALAHHARRGAPGAQVQYELVFKQRLTLEANMKEDTFIVNTTRLCCLVAAGVVNMCKTNGELLLPIRDRAQVISYSGCIHTGVSFPLTNFVNILSNRAFRT